MTRLLFGVIFFAALALGSVAARQGAREPQWEYLQLVPGLASRSIDERPVGYRACRAQGDGWTCRDFPAAQGTGASDLLAQAIATVGTQGWELVAVFDETQHLSYPKGRTYLFKRPRPNNR